MTPEERAREAVRLMLECSTPEGAALVVAGAIRAEVSKAVEEAVEAERQAIARVIEKANPICSACMAKISSYWRDGAPLCGICRDEFTDEPAPWAVIRDGLLERWEGPLVVPEGEAEVERLRAELEREKAARVDDARKTAEALEKLRGLVGRMAGVLRKLEWSGSRDGWPCCHVCEADPESGHHPGCEFNAALAEAEGIKP